MSRVLLVVPENKISPAFQNIQRQKFSDQKVFPVGVASIASSLSLKNEVKVMDMNFRDDKHFLDQIDNFNPDFIGVTSPSFLLSRSAHEVASLCKEHYDTKVVIGGPHASSVPRLVMNNRNIDFVIVGEAEETFSLLISGNKNIEGICYRRGKKLVLNPKRRFIEDLDSLPQPEYSLFDMEDYISSRNQHMFCKNMKAMPIVTSRGCPGNCFFCSVPNSLGSVWRARSAENVVNEIEYLKERYGVREIMFEDDNLTLNKKRTLEICSGMFSRGLNINWSTPNGVCINTLDREIIEAAGSSGCYHLKFGIETGSKILQKKIGKRISIEHAKMVKKSCDDLGIVTSAFFIVGLPGENKETLNETISFIENIDFENVQFSLPLPIPGTELFSYYHEKGLVELNRFGDIVDYKHEEGIIEILEHISDKWSRHVFFREINPFHWNLDHGRYSLFSHSYNLLKSINKYSSRRIRSILSG